jgi:hypothetical protein
MSNGALPQPDERCGERPGWVGSGRGSHGAAVPVMKPLLAVGDPVVGRLRHEPVMSVARTGRATDWSERPIWDAA